LTDDAQKTCETFINWVAQSGDAVAGSVENLASRRQPPLQLIAD
jgi:hypothetical protein